jgi:excisionase family DNA binding protein
MVEAKLYRAKEVAELLGVDTKTVYVWVRTGSIAHIRTPTGGVRIRGEEVDLMLAGKEVLGQEGWAAQSTSQEN